MTVELLNKIQSIVHQSSDILEETNGLTTVNSPAHEDELCKCNAHFSTKIPKDYLSFLRCCNGATFFNVKNLDGFKFLGCSELVKENTFQKEQLEDLWDECIIIICVCLGDGDYIGIKVINENYYEITDCFGEEIPANWKPIGASFDDFLERLIDEKGRKFWLDY